MSNWNQLQQLPAQKERLTQWFADFEKFLEKDEINDDPRYFWNADESGFALCPKSGKVLCQTNTKDLYTISGNCKDQITVLCVGSAKGEVIPQCRGKLEYKQNEKIKCKARVLEDEKKAKTKMQQEMKRKVKEAEKEKGIKNIFKDDTVTCKRE